jgi:hypothetical protein
MISQTGQENGRTEWRIERQLNRERTISKNEPVYYSFTMSSAQCVDGAGPRISAECVRGASPGFWRGFTGHFSE